MTENTTIIHSFQKRRQVEEAIAALATTQSEADLIQRAREMVDRFPSDLLIAGILRNVGSLSGQVRGGLGHLAALLSPDEIVAPLRGVVANRQLGILERTTAALILERYVGETVPPALLGDLAGSNDAALQSLLEAIAEGRSNRHVLLEYVTQMAEHSADVAYMVLGLLDHIDAPDRVELLRLIAQDARSQVARPALERLALLAADAENSQALRALHTLAQTIAPPLADVAERSLRKLQFTGRRYQPPAPSGWRALMSAADAGGYLSLWIVHDRDGANPDSVDDADRLGQGVLLGLVLAPQDGILDFSGVETMDRAQLPVRRPVGELVTIEDGRGRATLLLEIPFDVGRWLVRQALLAFWSHKAQPDLPGEYKLYNDLIWQFAPPLLSENEAPILRTSTNSGLDRPDLAALSEAADTLIYHPIFATWIGWAAAVWSSLQPASNTDQPLNGTALIAVVLREIDELPNRGQLQTSMAAALRLQALWLAIHQEREAAEHAQFLAHWMGALSVRQNPLLAGLLQAGLEKTLAS